MMNPNSGIFECLLFKNYPLGTWKASWESEEAKPHQKQFHILIESHWKVRWVEDEVSAQDGLLSLSLSLSVSLGELGSTTRAP